MQSFNIYIRIKNVLRLFGFANKCSKLWQFFMKLHNHVIHQNSRRQTMAGASKNARTTYTTQKFYCLCGGEITMKTLFDKGKLKNVAECTKCNRTERRPKDFN
jgi:hypothetical protein